MSAPSAPGVTSEQPDSTSGTMRATLDQSTLDGNGTTPVIVTARAAPPAPPAIRVRLLEAALRAERRHAATTEDRLQQVQASLQHALEQLEERRIAIAELQTILQATEPRLAALERELTTRSIEHQRPDAAAGAVLADSPLDAVGRAPAVIAPLREQLRARDAAYQALEHQLATTRAADAITQEQLRTAQLALAARLAAVERGTPNDTERRLRETALTLQHTLHELEESRLVPVELRAALAAAERRANTLDAKLAARARTVEALRAVRALAGHAPPNAGDDQASATSTTEGQRLRALESALQAAESQCEERRITCAELQTVLDATEQRLAAVQETLLERDSEIVALRARTTADDTPNAPNPDASQALLQDAQQQVTEVERQLQCTETTLAHTLEQLHERRTATLALEAMLGANTQRISALQEELAYRERECDARRAEYEAQRQRAHTESAEAREQFTETLAALRAEAATLADQVGTLTEALSGATIRAAADERDIAEWTTRHAAVHTQLGAAEARHRQVVHDLVTLRDQLQRYADEQHHLRSEVVRVQQEREDLAGRVFAARSEGAAAAQHARQLEAEATTLQATVSHLRQQIAERDADTEAVRHEADRTAAALRTFDERRTALEVELHTSAATCHALERALIAAQSERDGLRAHVSNLAAVGAAFEDERRQLHERAATLITEVATSQQETEHLRGQLAELERKHEEARQHYAAELHRDREAAQQQQALLREALRGQEALSQQLAALRATQIQTGAELDTLRDEHAVLVIRLREREAAPTPPTPPAPEPLHLASTETTERETSAAVPAGPLTIVHIDDQPICRDAVRAAVNRSAGARYVCPQFPPAGAIRGSTLLAINLLCRHLDPLGVIADADKWGVPEPRAFTYCSDGTRSIVLGLVDYFPFPFDPEACAARLFERPQGALRILTVSDHIELMTRLRTILSNGRCSTTVALDGRQALDLVKPVNPDTVLIDLALPRGEALDLVNRLRAEPTTAATPIAFLWTQKLGSGIFRQYAARVLQDWRGDSAGIGPTLLTLLSTPAPISEPFRHAG